MTFGDNNGRSDEFTNTGASRGLLVGRVFGNQKTKLRVVLDTNVIVSPRDFIEILRIRGS